MNLIVKQEVLDKIWVKELSVYNYNVYKLPFPIDSYDHLRIIHDDCYGITGCELGWEVEGIFSPDLWLCAEELDDDTTIIDLSSASKINIIN